MADNVTTGDFSNSSVTVATSDDGTAHAPRTVKNTAQASANFTRPADTTAYAANDAVSNSTSSPTVMTFSNCARVNAGMVCIADAALQVSNKNATVAEFHLFVLDAAPTMPNDNAAFAVSDAENQAVQCVLVFVPSHYSDTSNNAVYKLAAHSKNQWAKCAAASKALYGALQTRTAYTPTSAETYYVDLDVIQEA